MAFCASVWNLQTIYTGGRIFDRKDMMRSVAVGAHGGNNQTRLQKPFAVNAHHIVFQDIMLFPDIAVGGGAPFTVASATYELAH